MVDGRRSAGGYFTFTVDVNGTVVESEYATKITNVFTATNSTARETVRTRNVVDSVTLSNFVSKATDTWHCPFIVVDRYSHTEFLVLIAMGQIWRLSQNDNVQPTSVGPISVRIAPPK